MRRRPGSSFSIWGDIVFTGAVIKTVTQLAEDRSAAALPERLTKRKVGRLPAPGWREEEAALASQIENRADAKQEAIRREVWDEADRLQEEIRQLSIKREKLVRDNGPGRAV